MKVPARFVCGIVLVLAGVIFSAVRCNNRQVPNTSLSKSLSEASVALASTNWTMAVRILRHTSQASPDSETAQICYGALLLATGEWNGSKAQLNREAQLLERHERHQDASLLRQALAQDVGS